jgi:hypothetical protein
MKKHKKESAVGKKISKLRHEEVPEDQAVAEALNMKREGRLTESGGYRRSGRKKKRSSRRG